MLPEGLRASPLPYPFLQPLLGRRSLSIQWQCPHHRAGLLPNLLIFPIRTQTKPMRSGRLHQRVVTLPVSVGEIRKLPHQHC